jgi:hypothetical protein
MATPTGSDVTAFIEAMGATVPSGIDTSDLVVAATLEFERRTGRVKYEGDSSTTAVRYTLPWPQGANVILPIQDCWTVTEVRTGYTGAGTGTVLTEYTDFEYLPKNRPQTKQPIEAVRFVYTPTTAPGQILVTGKLGFAQTMPADVFSAIVANASANALIQMAGVSGTTTEEKQGDRSIKYGSGAESTISRLMGEFDRTAARYMRVI